MEDEYTLERNLRCRSISKEASDLFPGPTRPVDSPFSRSTTAGTFSISGRRRTKRSGAMKVGRVPSVSMTVFALSREFGSINKSFLSISMPSLTN